MGHTNVDLRNQAIKITQFLILEKLDNLQIDVETPNGENGHQFVLRISANLKQYKIKSLGANENFYLAILKANFELGEAIIAKEHNILLRSGLAGGFFKKNIVERAKAELIERDAFLFHYHSKIPFNKIGMIDILRHRTKYTFNIYEMSSASDRYFSCLVSPGIESLNGRKYIHFGTASGLKSIQYSTISKAIEEYFSLDIFKNHSKANIIKRYLNPNYSGPKSKHIAAVFDERNIELFQILMGQSSGEKTRLLSKNLENLWNVLQINSPIRGAKYFIVSNPELRKLMLDQNESDDHTNPLYHPFW
jgi:hypothetical protein